MLVSAELAPGFGEEFARLREEISADGRSKLGAERDLSRLQCWLAQLVRVLISPAWIREPLNHTKNTVDLEEAAHLALC